MHSSACAGRVGREGGGGGARGQGAGAGSHPMHQTLRTGTFAPSVSVPAICTAGRAELVAWVAAARRQSLSMLRARHASRAAVRRGVLVGNLVGDFLADCAE